MLIFVAGMHRSGTSLLTRLLCDNGALVAGTLLPGNLDNPTGYYEAKEVVTLNNQLLAETGRSWCDDRVLCEDELNHLRNKHIGLVKDCIASLLQD